MASQMVPLVTVSGKACAIPLAVNSTAPIRSMPRLSNKSPAFAHTTMAKTMTSVLNRSRFSLGILGELIVSESRTRSGNGNHGLAIFLAALARPLQAFRAQLQKLRRFGVQPLPLVAVPKRLFHDAPDHPRPEVVFIIETVHPGHHLGFGEVGVLDVRKLVATGIRQGLYLQETLHRQGVLSSRSSHGIPHGNLNGFTIHFLGKFDGFLNGLFRLTRQANNEIAVHFDS